MWWLSDLKGERVRMDPMFLAFDSDLGAYWFLNKVINFPKAKHFFSIIRRRYTHYST